MYIDVKTCIFKNNKVNNNTIFDINKIYTNDIKQINDNKFLQFMCDTFANIYIPKSNFILSLFQNIHVNIVMCNLRIHDDFYKLLAYKEEINKYFFDVLNKDNNLIVFNKCGNLNLIDHNISSFKKNLIDKYGYFKQRIDFINGEMRYLDVDRFCGINKNDISGAKRNYIFKLKYDIGLSIIYYMKDDIIVQIDFIYKTASGNYFHIIKPLKDYIEDLNNIKNNNIKNTIYPMNVSNLFLKNILKYNKKYYFDYFKLNLSLTTLLNNKFIINDNKTTLDLLERICNGCSNNIIFIPFEYIIFGDKNNTLSIVSKINKHNLTNIMYLYVNKLVHFVSYEKILLLNDFNNNITYLFCQDYDNLYFKFNNNDIYLGYNNYFENININNIVDNKDFSNIYRYNIFNVIQTNKQMFVFEKNIFQFKYDFKKNYLYQYNKINVDAPYEYINFDAIQNKYNFLVNIIYGSNDILLKKMIHYIYKSNISIYLHFNRSPWISGEYNIEYIKDYRAYNRGEADREKYLYEYIYNKNNITEILFVDGIYFMERTLNYPKNKTLFCNLQKKILPASPMD